MQEVSFAIEPLAPFRLDLTVWLLRRRPNYVVDQWDGRVYRRILVLDGQPVEVAVTEAGDALAPRLAVVARGACVSADAVPVLERTLRQMLGTDRDLSDFYGMAETGDGFSELVTRLRGLKPTRYPTVYEGLVNAIACQQITLTFGLQIVSRLAEECGLPYRDGDRIGWAFPRPEDVLAVSPERLKEIGFSRQKARALLELSEALAGGTLRLDHLESMSDAEAIAFLRSLRGVGRWTAEYVLLRALGRIHIFPGDDVGGRNNLRRWLQIEEPLDYDGVQRALGAWRDYGGLLYFHLLLAKLDDAGHVRGADG